MLTKPGAFVTLSVPDHPEVARGTMRTLIAKPGLTVEEFPAALRAAPLLSAYRPKGPPRSRRLIFGPSSQSKCARAAALS